jgi:hypothetical protein
LTAAVSAPSFYRFNGGHVCAYSFDADSSDWIQIGQVERAAAGVSVDLSADGRTLTIGAGAPFAFSETGWAEVWTFNEDSKEWAAVGETITAEVGDKRAIVSYWLRMLLFWLSATEAITLSIVSDMVVFAPFRYPMVRQSRQLGSDTLWEPQREASTASFRVLPGFAFVKATGARLGQGSILKDTMEENNWVTDFVAISGDGKRLVVGGPLPEPNWRDVLVSCPDFSDKLVGYIRVFDLSLATMPPSMQPTLAPNSDPTPSNTAPTAQPTTSPTLAPSESGDTLAALASAALTQGLPFDHVDVSVIGTFLLYL